MPGGIPAVASCHLGPPDALEHPAAERRILEALRWGIQSALVSGVEKYVSCDLGIAPGERTAGREKSR